MDVWAGAIAVNAMCVGVLGHPGIAVLAEGLKVTLSPPQLHKGHGRLNLTATS